MSLISDILGFLPQWMWTLILVSGLLGLIASWILKYNPFINTYRIPVQLFSVIFVVLGIYYHGVLDNEKKWKERVAKLELELSIKEKESENLNLQIESTLQKQKVLQAELNKRLMNYLDRWSTIEVLRETEGPERVRIEQIIKYIEKCPIPKEFINVHNEAAKGASK